MTRTRTELETELSALEQAVATLLAEHEDPADFWPAFAWQADAIVEAAGPADSEWVHERLDELLARHGLDGLGA